MILQNVELKDVPPPVEKILEFDQDGLHYRVLITDNILIDSDDPNIPFLNVYKDVCKIIATVTSERKQLRFESKQYYKNDVLAHWDEELAVLIIKAKKCFADPKIEWMLNKSNKF